jgi:hypothetical protein
VNCWPVSATARITKSIFRAAGGDGFPVLAQHYPVLTELSRDHRQIAEFLDRLKDLSTIDVVPVGEKGSVSRAVTV